ncbi:MAG: hypothetical protein SGJ24_04480 [Chloroflexota bacterium]|nr:hypothetical protein [Chloroflexota bacterium]
MIGMYTVAYGAPARVCAERLITSWRRHMPSVPMVIATDDADMFEDKDCTALDLRRPDIGAREPKLRMFDATPEDWDCVLYLDADIEILESVVYLFEALAAGWDMVLTRNPGKYHTTREMIRPNNHAEVEETWEVMGSNDRLQWNGGVIGFRRSPAMADVFTAWLREWQRNAQQDQPALHRALWQHPCRVLTLGSEWNRSTRYDDGTAREIIRHHQMEAREMVGKLEEGVRGDSAEAWARLRGRRK